MNNAVKEIMEKLPTQYSEEFWTRMKARMEMSFLKYGDIRDGYPRKVDAIASLMLRLKKYDQTGNTEFLVDAANFCMIEFMLPRHPNHKFEATDSDQSPGRQSVHGRVSADPNVRKHEYKNEGD